MTVSSTNKRVNFLSNDHSVAILGLKCWHLAKLLHTFVFDRARRVHKSGALAQSDPWPILPTVSAVICPGAGVCVGRQDRRCGIHGRCRGGGPQGCPMRQSGVMMWGRESRGERWERRRKLERVFLVIILPVTSSRFLAGGVWAVRAENAIIPMHPCETCTVCET